MRCDNCDTPLTGGLDTYGEPGENYCWGCWSDPAFNDVLQMFDRLGVPGEDVSKATVVYEISRYLEKGYFDGPDEEKAWNALYWLTREPDSLPSPV